MRVLRYIWASPNTALGVCVAALGVLTGGRVRLVGGVVEAWGGAIGWVLRRVPIEGGAMAMTIGHVVIGQTAAGLDASRAHERVHVRQYERWGPAFIPAYFIASAIAWRRGGDAYRDNRFEREAYDASAIGDCGPPEG